MPKMNFKKLISLSILLFVNVIILAHAAVPHHHHEAKHILFALYCEDCSDEHNHEHELTDDIFNIPTNKCTKNLCRSYTNCDCKNEFLTSSILNTQDFVDDTITCFRQKPFIFSFYTEFAAQSFGLRAPPAC